MTTIRKHPARYEREYFDLFRGLKDGKKKAVTFISPVDAYNYRIMLYTFRYSLRTHPRYDPEVLAIADKCRFHLKDNTLTIIHYE